MMCGFSSCEDYLDKDPDSNVSPETPFKNFQNAQGYVEEIYNCIPNKAQCDWTTSWNLGDDEIQNPQADDMMLHQVDIGNYYAWQGSGGFYFGNKAFGGNPRSNSPFDHIVESRR